VPATRELCGFRKLRQWASGARGRSRTRRQRVALATARHINGELPGPAWPRAAWLSHQSLQESIVTASGTGPARNGTTDRSPARAASAASRTQTPGQPSLRGVRTVVLTGGVLLVVGALHLARDFLVPVAVAGLLTFVLSPIVRVFEQRLPRAVAVLLVVLLAFSILAGLGWALASQAASLGENIPAYRDNLKRKIAEVRIANRGSVLDKVQLASKEVVEELQKTDQPLKPGEMPVPVVSQSSNFWRLPTLLAAIANVGLVLALVVFMLLERLQLRDRLIRVIGFGRIATTTKAMDEAAQRITHYLSMQTLVNGIFGLGVTLIALLVGLPYGFLWGFLAAVLRFIPYVGPWAGAFIVSLAGLAVFDGWLQPALLVGLFVALELSISFVLEMYLYSQSAGVSQVALLLAVAFWTWVWGPIGLALATPLTVCLVVLTKYVPDLDIVSLLMSDEPVMSPAQTYYQRLVARDESEAATLVQEFLKSHPDRDLHDEVFVPALILAQRDCRRDRITDADMRFVEQATRDLVEELALTESPAAGAATPDTLVLGFPAQEEADEIALLMIKQRLDPGRIAMDVASPNLLASEAIATVEAREPAAVLIGALAGPGHALQLRYLCKRLRARFPELPIVVGWWGGDGGQESIRSALVSAGADRVNLNLAEAAAQVQELASVRRGGRAPTLVASTR
jgi:predicted PurR-regulated permease PerM